MTLLLIFLFIIAQFYIINFNKTRLAIVTEAFNVYGRSTVVNTAASSCRWVVARDWFWPGAPWGKSWLSLLGWSTKESLQSTWLISSSALATKETMLLWLMHRLKAAKISHGGLLVYRIMKFVLDFCVSKKQTWLWCVILGVLIRFHSGNLSFKFLATINPNYISMVYLDILPHRIIIICNH